MFSFQTPGPSWAASGIGKTMEMTRVDVGRHLRQPGIGTPYEIDTGCSSPIPPGLGEGRRQGVEIAPDIINRGRVKKCRESADTLPRVVVMGSPTPVN